MSSEETPQSPENGEQEDLPDLDTMKDNIEKKREKTEEELRESAERYEIDYDQLSPHVREILKKAKHDKLFEKYRSQPDDLPKDPNLESKIESVVRGILENMETLNDFHAAIHVPGSRKYVKEFLQENETSLREEQEKLESKQEAKEQSEKEQEADGIPETKQPETEPASERIKAGDHVQLIDGGARRWSEPLVVESVGITDPSGREYAKVAGRDELFLVDKLTKVEQSGFVNNRIAEQFKSEFNITKENLRNVPGFAGLSEGQQRLVLDNFRQMTLNRIEEEGVKSYREDKAESGKLSSMWKGFLSSYYKEKAKARVGEELVKGGGIDVHKDVLVDVIAKTKESGMSLDETGQLVFAQESAGMSTEEAEITARFNRVAQEFSKISSNWRYEDFITENITGSTREEYQKKLAEYKEALKDYVELAKQSDKISIEDVMEADKRVRFTQFFASNRDYEKAIQQIKDEPRARRILDNVVAEKGGYFALGYVGRTISYGTIGIVGAPIVAATLAAFRGRTKAVESLEEEAIARRGGAQAGVFRNLDTTFDTVGSAEKQAEVINTVSADSLNKKLRDLLDQLEIAGKDEAEKLSQKLNRRVYYTKQKLEDGLVNYGETEGRTGRQYELLQTLSEAQAIDVLENDSDVEDDIKARLDRYLDYKDEKTRRYVHEKTAYGAALGATFASLGVAARELGLFAGDETAETVAEGGSPEGVESVADVDATANQDATIVGADDTAGVGEEKGAGFFESQDTAAEETDLHHTEPVEPVANDATEQLSGGDNSLARVEITEWDGSPMYENSTKARSFIEAAADIKEQLAAANLDAHPELKELLEAENAEALAEKLGGYNPDELRESLVVHSGDTFSVTENGDLIIEHADGTPGGGTTDVLFDADSGEFNPDALDDDVFKDYGGVSEAANTPGEKAATSISAEEGAVNISGDSDIAETIEPSSLTESAGGEEMAVPEPPTESAETATETANIAETTADIASPESTHQAAGVLSDRFEDADKVLHETIDSYLETGGEPSYIEGLELPQGMSSGELRDHIYALDDHTQLTQSLHALEDTQPQRFQALKALYNARFEHLSDPEIPESFVGEENNELLHSSLNEYLNSDASVELAGGAGETAPEIEINTGSEATPAEASDAQPAEESGELSSEDKQILHESGIDLDEEAAGDTTSDTTSTTAEAEASQSGEEIETTTGEEALGSETTGSVPEHPTRQQVISLISDNTELNSYPQNLAGNLSVSDAPGLGVSENDLNSLIDYMSSNNNRGLVTVISEMKGDNPSHLATLSELFEYHMEHPGEVRLGIDISEDHIKMLDNYVDDQFQAAMESVQGGEGGEGVLGTVEEGVETAEDVKDQLEDIGDILE